ncbi:MAG: LysM peptidoglycan-binding domain-containing protein [Candidatus Omnitrophota bacterium]|nr:LysM peptidoglycan-binding domain-containing protein [Candidatus Omnitrophota bacterium]
MKKVFLSTLCLLFTLFLTGCVKTYTYQAERKDQAIHGNRGMISGKIPESPPDRKRTRTMLGIDVELPPSEEYKTEKEELEEKTGRKKPPAEKTLTPVRETAVTKKKEKSVRFTGKQPPVRRPREITYTIQKGDTLEKIAKKFFGRASKWAEIYNANKGIITSPSKIYPGQVIVIPQIAVKEKAAEKHNYK